MLRQLRRTLGLYRALWQHRGWRQQLAAGFRRSGDPLLVLGAAPGSQLPQGWQPHFPYIAINASQAAGVQLGLGPPRLVVMSPGPLFGDSEADRNAQVKLRGGRAETLLYVERKYAFADALSVLGGIGYAQDEALAMSPDERNHIIRAVSGRDWGRGETEDRVSNGLFAIMLALYLKAPAVVVAGIAPQSMGHAYNDANQPRLHAATDAEALRLLARKYRNLYAAAPDLAAAYGLPVWQAAKPF